jgi:RNA polymerase sigma-70 factor (ECF subfamily)
LITRSPSSSQFSLMEAGSIRTEPGQPASPCPVLLDFDALYDEHFAFVWRTARRLGVPEPAADDVVQDVFLVVHRRLGDYQGDTPPKRWILGITTRVVADRRRTYWRKDSRCVPHEVDDHGTETHASPHPGPHEEAEQAETLRLVVSLLDEIDHEKREVLVLSEFEEMNNFEIASLLALNVNTVSSRLRAARKAFDAAYARHRARNAWRTR